MAATVLMAVSVFWWVHQAREVEQLRSQVVMKDAEVARTKDLLEQQRTEAARDVEELRGEIDEAARGLAEREETVAQLRQELAASPSSGVEANYPVYFLANGRGGAGEYEISPQGQKRMYLVVEVIDAEPYALYGVELIERSTGVMLWESDSMVRRGSALTLSVPSSMFESGFYDLLLYGIDDDGSRVLLEERYPLKVR